jgi:integrase/recombinase XerC
LIDREGGLNVNITVYRALPLPRIDALPEAEFALVPGTPFLVDDDSLTVIEGALLYMKGRFPQISVPHRRKRLGRSKHTLDAAAYDLAHFIQMVEDRTADWGKVDDAFVLAYCEDLLNAVSARTGQPLEANTILRRASRGLDYCRWRSDYGLMVAVEHFDISWYRNELGLGNKPYDDATPRDDDVESPLFSSRPLLDSARSPEPAFVLKQRQWESLKVDLGPLPSERNNCNIRPSRDRVACELSISSGMRVDEIAQLSIYQILDLRIDATIEDDEPQELYIQKTKGLRARYVNVPTYLIREAQQYIRTARQDAIAEAKKYWLREGAKPPSALFLNGKEAHKDAGRPVVADTLSRRFHESVIRCGYIRHVEAQAGVLIVAMFVFHCLRHTYAKWVYHAEKACGNSEPWKILQTRLGHVHLSTTMRTYMRFDESERRSVNAATFNEIRRRYRGD